MTDLPNSESFQALSASAAEGVSPAGDLPVLAEDDAETLSQPRRRRSFRFHFGVAFVLGFLLVAGIGTGVIYAWGKQYDGRVLPGGAVHLGDDGLIVAVTVLEITFLALVRSTCRPSAEMP